MPDAKADFKTVAILVLDIEKSADLNEVELETISSEIWPKLSDLVNDSHYSGNIVHTDRENEILEMNTWGDGFVIVSESVFRLSQVSLELRNYFRDRKYSVLFKNLINKKLNCRISLDYGRTPYFKNPFNDDKDSYFGWNFYRCDQLNSKIEANKVFITEDFKKALKDLLQRERMNEVLPFHYNEQPIPTIDLEFDKIDVYELCANEMELEYSSGSFRETGSSSESKKSDKEVNCDDEIFKKYFKRINTITGIEEANLKKILCTDENLFKLFPETVCSIIELYKIIKTYRDLEKLLIGINDCIQPIEKLSRFIRNFDGNTIEDNNDIYDFYGLLKSAKESVIRDLKYVVIVKNELNMTFGSPAVISKDDLLRRDVEKTLSEQELWEARFYGLFHKTAKCSKGKNFENFEILVKFLEDVPYGKITNPDYKKELKDKFEECRSEIPFWKSVVTVPLVFSEAVKDKSQELKNETIEKIDELLQSLESTESGLDLIRKLIEDLPCRWRSDLKS